MIGPPAGRLPAPSPLGVPLIDLRAPIISWMPIAWYTGFMAGLPDLRVGRCPPGIAVEASWKLWAVEPRRSAKRL